MKSNVIFLGLALLFLTACSRSVTDSMPENTPETNFELLWQEYDRLYISFEQKGVDWDSVYAIYRPLVHAQTTDRELFAILSSMIATLKDGHADLQAPFGAFAYDLADGYPLNYNKDVVLERYLSGTMNGTNSPITFQLVDSQIGYIRIASFSGNGWAGKIETALKTMIPLTGLIVDVRNNPGGTDLNSRAVAGRFTNQKNIYSYIQWRQGPDHNHVTLPEVQELKPEGSVRFLEPIVVLTNRRTFSAAEDFVLMMQTLPHVTIVGDTTGGGTNIPVGRELPNGWVYRVSRGRILTLEKESSDGIGLSPDIWVSTPDVVLNAGTDLIFEKAVELLRSK